MEFQLGKEVKIACSKFTCTSGFIWQQNPRTGRNIDDKMVHKKERSFQAKHVVFWENISDHFFSRSKKNPIQPEIPFTPFLPFYAMIIH